MQFGFRANHSTEIANCVLSEMIKSHLDKNTYVGAVFLDLKKAFDTVNHQVLMAKLSHFNFSVDALFWFQSYLSNRTQCVTIDGIKSTHLGNPAGVPQGSILGPLLFSLYINDLPDICPSLNVQMYADDAVIFTEGKNAETIAAKLTSGLLEVKSWLSDTCLTLNTKKTVCMMFSKKPKKLIRSHVFYDGTELELVPHFKYLGVVLDSTLSFKKHIKKVANTIKFSIQNFKQIRPFITAGAAKSYLHCMILSHIEYCLPVWSITGTTILHPIKLLYKRAIKVFDRKPLSYHHCTILEKYHLLSFNNFRLFKSLCLIYKCLNGLAPPPLRQFVTRRNNKVKTRAATRGDCQIQTRKYSLPQNTWSIRGSTSWNKLPLPLRESPSLNSFKRKLKIWLKINQHCQHKPEAPNKFYTGTLYRLIPAIIEESSAIFRSVCPFYYFTYLTVI